jgi:hypothetical protein
VRRRYQTEEDLHNEREVAAALERHYHLTAIKLPDNSRADFLMHRDGTATSVVEIKCRNVSSAKYETLMLSKAKYYALLDWADRGFKAALAVRWTDCIGVCPIPVEHTLGTGGRSDRGDALDIESVVHIPIDRFRMI